MLQVISHQDTKDHGKFRWHHHKHTDNEEEDWWFASTAGPLIAATVGPVANVFSIAALVVYWRMSLVQGGKSQESAWNGDISTLVPELEGTAFQDPHWCYDLNAVSLACGFLGNLFLLANFTNRIRYIIALPASIVLWYFATGILIGITASMEIYEPPNRPQETYTQGFWYAVLAAIMYCICSMILMLNMLGYFLGHYGQHFNLTDSQRTLILQTMMFFIWLGAGAGIFSNVETKYGHQSWLFTDALYFCDVTILTIGFGDLYPMDDVGRGLVFPYTVGGTIVLGLVINSLTKFVKEIGADKIVRKRANVAREKTVERSQLAEQKLRERGGRLSISSPSNGHRLRSPIKEQVDSAHPSEGRPATSESSKNRLVQGAHKVVHIARPKQKRRLSRAMVLREEKERFDAMRRIQHSTRAFKRYMALVISATAFAILWCVGAAVFFVTERYTQGLSYFRALYFAYVSLLTIGYGDEAPKSNAGRPFFVLWSLLAVPTMTILVSHMGDTVISHFQKGTNLLADFTVLPKYGIWREVLSKNPWLMSKIEKRAERKAEEKRVEAGFEAGPSSEDGDESDEKVESPTLDNLAEQEDAPLTEQELARRLALMIRKTAQFTKTGQQKRYSYEEWVEITELIRFTSKKRQKRLREGGSAETEEDLEEDEEDLVEWDWIGENSPMMAFGKSEPEFVLDRLCESMVRYVKAQASD